MPWCQALCQACNCASAIAPDPVSELYLHILYCAGRLEPLSRSNQEQACAASHHQRLLPSDQRGQGLYCSEQLRAVVSKVSLTTKQRDTVTHDSKLGRSGQPSICGVRRVCTLMLSTDIWVRARHCVSYRQRSVQVLKTFSCFSQRLLYEDTSQDSSLRLTTTTFANARHWRISSCTL